MPLSLLRSSSHLQPTRQAGKLCVAGDVWTWTAIDADIKAGVAKVVRQDNLKAAVVRACFFDPDSHDVYLALAAHWGLTALPTQPGNPKDNGKQERSGGYVKANALKGR